MTELRGVGWKPLDEADVLYVESTSLSFSIKQSCESISLCVIKCVAIQCT